jgi:hypothetical protein
VTSLVFHVLSCLTVIFFVIIFSSLCIGSAMGFIYKSQFIGSAMGIIYKVRAKA